MKDFLSKLATGEDLSRDQAAAAFESILTGQAEPAQIGALLMGIAAKGPSLDELVAAATVMRQHSIRIDLPNGDGRTALDVCGTGGSGHRHGGIFNISTASAIVIAAAGVTVVKHGNRAATSKSGSADVLEALGVKLDITPQRATACLTEANLCFAFARAHHPAMKHVAPVRASLAIPTIFNLLGPLTNPAGATHQLMGVFRRDLLELMAAALLDLGTKRAWVVHAEDGLDELSTLSPTHVVEVQDGTLSETIFAPQTVGIPWARLDDLRAGSPAESAQMIKAVLAGLPGPTSDIVALNAAAGLVIAGRADSIGVGLAKAREAIASGAAAATLEKLVRASNV